MANFKSKSLIGALALAGSLLMATATFAQTATPPATPEPPATLAPATMTPITTMAPAATPLPREMEDDRRILRGDRTISGENFVLRSGETLHGDLTVFGGNVTLEESSIVEGNVNMFGGNADVAGSVTGDISLVGGNVLLRNSAVVDGDISKMGGTVTRSPGALVRGSESAMSVPAIPGFGDDNRDEPRVIVRDNNSPFNWLFSVITSTITTVLGAILISLLALAIVALLPNNVAQAASVLTANWLMSGVVGALTLFAVPIIAVVLAITICLIPFSLLLVLALAAAIVAGWTISARILGERVMHAVHRSDWTMIGQTVAGAVLLALLGAVPILGGLIGFVATALGLGALVLTRAGTRPYPMPVTAPVFAPIGPASPAAATTDYQPVMRTESAPPAATPPATAPASAPASDVPAATPSTPSEEWWKTDAPAAQDRPSTVEPPAGDAPSADNPRQDEPPANPT
jgi:hypothetical protein